MKTLRAMLFGHPSFRPRARYVLRSSIARILLPEKTQLAFAFGRYVFCRQSKISARTFHHEQAHVDQYFRLGIVRFLALYAWYQLRHGYKHNPLEIEARDYAANMLRLRVN